MSTEEDYRALAAAALAKLPAATSEAERTQLKRANAAYLKLATHQIEADARAAAPKPKRIIPERPAETKPSGIFTRNY
jgi:hypothetical protein